MIEVEFVLDDLLHKPHQEVFVDESRFVVIAAGRRWGKSFLAVLKLLKAAYENPGKNFYYLAPTISQARTIAWEILKEKAIDELVAKTNESRLEITFINGAKISLKSSERSDSLRGVSLSGIVLDETASFRDFETTWQKVVRPSLSDQQGWAWFISSPAGKNWFFDLYNNAKGLDDWNSYQFTTLSGGWVPEEEVATARKELDPKSFRQEYESQFEDWQGVICPAFDRSTHFEYNFELLPDEPILAGSDLNVTRMPMALCVQREGVIICFDELIGDLDTPALIKSLLRRYGDRHITIYPDASSGNRSTVGADKTNVTLFREHFEVKKRAANPRITDRINAFNVMLMSGDSTVRFKVTPNCKNLIESLEKHSYDPNTNQPDKKSNLDHMFDAISYLTYWFSPLTKRVVKVKGFRL